MWSSAAVANPHPSLVCTFTDGFLHYAVDLCGYWNNGYIPVTLNLGISSLAILLGPDRPKGGVANVYATHWLNATIQTILCQL